MFTTDAIRKLKLKVLMTSTSLTLIKIEEAEFQTVH